MEFGWIAAILAVFAIGLALLVMGLRGRRVGDHPHCRKCGFDLYGLDAFSALCPECGADRTGKRAVRIGKRKRRPIIATLGATLVLASLAAAGAFLWGRATQFDWNTIKPAWLLLQEARLNDAAMRDPALAELFARDSAGTLRTGHRHEMLDVILEIQGNAAIPWRDDWGDALVQAHADGDLDDARFKKFLEQSVAFELDVRPQVRTGTWLLSRLRREARGMTGPDLWLKVVTMSVRIDDMEYFRQGGFSSRSPIGSGASGYSITVTNEPGEYLLHGEWEVYITREDPADVLHSWTLELAADVTVTDESGDPVTMIADADLHAEIAERTSVDGLRIRDADAEGRRWVETTVNFRDLPINVGFDVYWRIGEDEWFLGTAAIGAMRGNHGFGHHERIEGLPDEVESVTVVLRASEEAARRTTDLTEIWDGELIFENVPVERRPALPSP